MYLVQSACCRMAEEMSLANHAKRRRINEEEESSKESADADQPAPEGAQAPEEEEPLAMLARVRGERTDLLAARAAATALAGISEGAAADAGAGADRHDLALSLRLDPGPAHDQRGDMATMPRADVYVWRGCCRSDSRGRRGRQTILCAIDLSVRGGAARAVHVPGSATRQTGHDQDNDQILRIGIVRETTDPWDPNHGAGRASVHRCRAHEGRVSRLFNLL